ncbi:Rieske 2Fe-2S domain-containing protein [Sporichthya brevicatena]|uniref:Rieske 2Fe-2S domain-containing protein n=1 Tax=Sporichthya brevicatena TaxID=171442 RepID=UPI0031E0F73E
MRRSASNWIAAAWSDDVVAGALVPTRVEGMDLLLYRDADGHVRAADRRCPRRGYPLTDGSVEPTGIRSSVDGWLWSFDGSATEPSGVVHRSEPGLVLRHHAVTEVHGLVLVCGGERVPPDVPRLPSPEAWISRPTTRAVASHPLAVLESLADPCTLSYVLGVGVTGEPRVPVATDDVLHLQFAVDRRPECTVDVRAFGTLLMSVSATGHNSGGALIGTTPTGADESLELRTCAWGGGADWAGMAGRLAEVVAAVRRDQERVVPARRSGLAVVRTWIGRA